MRPDRLKTALAGRFAPASHTLKNSTKHIKNCMGLKHSSIHESLKQAAPAPYSGTDGVPEGDDWVNYTIASSKYGKEEITHEGADFLETVLDTFRSVWDDRGFDDKVSLDIWIDENEKAGMIDETIDQGMGEEVGPMFPGNYRNPF